MKEVLKNLKRLFVIEEEVEERPAAAPVRETGGNAEAVPAQENPVPAPGSPSRFLDILLEAFQKNNQEGFDYLEFRKSLQSLQDMSMDEPTRYQSAYAVAKTLGVSKNQIADSANHYLNVLELETVKFQEAVGKQTASQVEAKTIEIAASSKELEEKNKQIQVLQDQIVQLQAKIGQMQMQKEQAAQTIQGTQADFAAAKQLLLHQIQADLEKINTYLQ